MTEIMTEKYVIYRAFHGDLDYMAEGKWDDLVATRSITSNTYSAVEVSRGHTLVEAINLTDFVNKQLYLGKQK